MSQFRVEFSTFTGPLALLAQLAREEEVDLLAIALAEITRRYLAELTRAPIPPIEEVGEFLVTLSTLMELKARRLLPPADVDDIEPESEARHELVKQLLEYRRFREAAELLEERARLRQAKLRREVNESGAMADATERPIRDLELWDLVSAFSRLMRETLVPSADQLVLDHTPISVYMEQLRSSVLESGGMAFEELIGRDASRSQLIGRFLALLELIKQGHVWLEVGEEGIRLLPPRPLDESVVPESDSIPMADQTMPPEVRFGSGGTGEQPDSPPSAPRRAWDDFEPLIDEDPPAAGA